MKIFILASYPPTIISFRGDLIKLLLNNGNQLIIGAPFNKYEDKFRSQLKDLDITTLDFPLARTSLNPYFFLRSLFYSIFTLFRYKPDCLLPYTITPVILLGSISTFLNFFGFKKIKIFPIITGLGSIFTNKPFNLKSKIIYYLIIYLYKFALKKANTIIFQNPDDIDFFLKKSIIDSSQNVKRVYGSGVNLIKYPFTNVPKNHIFLMVARVLKDKGIYEYVNAAKKVLAKRKDVKFILIGDFDLNPFSISRKEVENWNNTGIIKYLGFKENVQLYIKKCRYFVLPSYREGTPRSSLEALSSGRPIITTNAPGCKETVIDGYNGLLVSPKDSHQLYVAMMKMISYEEKKIQKMGLASRKMAEEFYDSQKVSSEYYKILFHGK